MRSKGAVRYTVGTCRNRLPVYDNRLICDAHSADYICRVFNAENGWRWRGLCYRAANAVDSATPSPELPEELERPDSAHFRAAASCPVHAAAGTSSRRNGTMSTFGALQAPATIDSCGQMTGGAGPSVALPRTVLQVPIPVKANLDRPNCLGMK